MALSTFARRALRATKPIRTVGALRALHSTGRCVAASEQKVDVPAPIPSRVKAQKAAAPRELCDLNVGFIGWGAMAQAVSLGMVREKLIDPSRIMACDVVPEVMARAKEEGLRCAQSNLELVEWADVIVVATKPQVVDPVILEAASEWRKEKTLVSICAGVTIERFESLLGCEGSKIVRVMPNTPCLVGQAATAYAGNANCGEWELNLVHGIFAAVGRATHRVPEAMLDTVTGVSGSGPAYVYMLIQAMSDAGVYGGLPRTVAQSLAVQTVIGAAKMVQQSGAHPSVLKEAVTSPAGTTIAAVRVLEQKNFNSAVIEAVEAARSRSLELSRTPEVAAKRPQRVTSVQNVSVNAADNTNGAQYVNGTNGLNGLNGTNGAHRSQHA